MSDQNNIPILTDLIESGEEISITDLGLDEELGLGAEDPAIVDTGAEQMGETDDTDAELVVVVVDPFKNNPALEQNIRRILDEHMELAWQEIKLAIQKELDKL
jgi:hypothetical protein